MKRQGPPSAAAPPKVVAVTVKLGGAVTADSVRRSLSQLLNCDVGHLSSAPPPSDSPAPADPARRVLRFSVADPAAADGAPALDYRLAKMLSLDSSALSIATLDAPTSRGAAKASLSGAARSAARAGVDVDEFFEEDDRSGEPKRKKMAVVLRRGRTVELDPRCTVEASRCPVALSGEEEARRVFGACGGVRQVLIRRDIAGVFKGRITVEFENEEAAQRAVKELPSSAVPGARIVVRMTPTKTFKPQRKIS